MTNTNTTNITNTTRQLEAELRALLDGVQAEEQRETDEARAAYRDLLFRLARDEHREGDTPLEMHRIAKEAGRSAGQLLADVQELRELVRLAGEASQLAQRREADREATAALRAGKERFERALKKAKARVDALERARDDTSRALYASDEARRALLARLGLAGLHQDKLRALSAAQARLERSRGSDEEADAQEEVEGRCRDVWGLCERATTLDDYSPFRDGSDARNAPPLVREDFSWNQVNEAEQPTAE
jgi:hypothetical protein